VALAADAVPLGRLRGHSTGPLGEDGGYVVVGRQEPVKLRCLTCGRRSLHWRAAVGLPAPFPGTLPGQGSGCTRDHDHGWADFDGIHEAPEATALSGATVAGWLDRFGAVIAAEYAEREWPQSLVLDSTEFLWTNPRTGDKEQMFSVLAAWATRPAPGAAGCGRWRLRRRTTRRRGRRSSTGCREPELVVYDSDKAIHSAVRRKWPTVPIHLCEHHLYSNAKKHLRKDGQEGWGNTSRTLLAAAGQSPEGWAAFRNAVLAEPTLAETSAWVRHWDADMTVQTARRASMPPHCSTGALDPHIAAVRQ
jgi:hypothetical protein